MKNFRVVFSVVAALLLGSVVQAQQHRVDANIPFNFLVGDKVYPAGDYTIQSARTGERELRIDYTGESHATLVPTNPCSSVRPAEQTKVVFHRVGGTYFLYQIWIQGNDVGSEFPKGKTQIEMASNQKPDLVVVAANLVH